MSPTISQVHNFFIWILIKKVSNYKIVILMRFFQCHVLQLYERSFDPFYLGFSRWNQTINLSLLTLIFNSQFKIKNMNSLSLFKLWGCPNGIISFLIWIRFTPFTFVPMVQNILGFSMLKSSSQESYYCFLFTCQRWSCHVLLLCLLWPWFYFENMKLYTI
jgi:hypothetical protein